MYYQILLYVPTFFMKLNKKLTFKFFFEKSTLRTKGVLSLYMSELYLTLCIVYEFVAETINYLY